jgi:GGDEF domain-containing protein
LIKTAGSIGVSLYPDDGDDNDTIIGKADAAMYVAKRSGGGIATYDEATEIQNQEPAA